MTLPNLAARWKSTTAGAVAALGLVVLPSTSGCAGRATPAPAPPPVLTPEVRRLVTYVELPTVSYADTDCPRRRYLGPGVARALQEAVQAELTRRGMQVTTDAAVPEQLVLRFEPGVGGLHRGAGLRLVRGHSRRRREALDPTGGEAACGSRGLRRVRRDELLPGPIYCGAPDGPRCDRIAGPRGVRHEPHSRRAGRCGHGQRRPVALSAHSQSAPAIARRTLMSNALVGILRHGTSCCWRGTRSRADHYRSRPPQ